MRRPRRRPDDTAHLEPDILAEFRAALITGRRGARIGAHLAACDQCTALNDELAGVSALLAAVPATAMPDSVARRLDTALAAEVAQRNIDAERADGNSSRKAGAHKRPTGNHGFRWAAWRVLAPAGAVVLLAAGGYQLSHLGGGPVAQGAASSAGRAVSTPDHAANAPDEAGTRAAGPAGSAPQAGVRRVSPAAFPLVVSRTVFLPATFEQQVQAALRTPAADRTTQSASPAVRACVQAVTDGAHPVLVESARFGDQPATIIAVRTGQGYTAWAAGSRCSAAYHDLLISRTVP